MSRDAAQSHSLYRALSKSGKTEQLFRVGRRDLSVEIENILAAWLRKDRVPSVPTEVLAYYLANEIFSMLTWWLERDMPYTPEEMDKMFHQLVMPGFAKGIGTI